MRRIIGQGIVAIGLAALMVACGGSSDSPTTPTTPSTAVSVTDTYTGDLLLGATKVHSFSVGAGVVTATLTALSPLATASIGMAFGTWDGTNCNAIVPTVVQNDNMKVGTTLTGTATTTVSMCLRVYDVGNIPDGATYSYTVTVTHF